MRLVRLMFAVCFALLFSCLITLDCRADYQQDQLNRQRLNAAWKGKSEVAAFWEQQNIDLNARNSDGATLLMSAAGLPNSNAVAFLLNRGAEVDARDDQGHTALMATVWWVQYDLVMAGREEECAQVGQQLLIWGADINARDNRDMTALMYAAGWRHLPALKMLLEHGASVNLHDRIGRTALTWAARAGADSKIVRALRQHGATIGLLEAILLNDLVTTRQVLAGKADLTERDAYGETALMVAAERGNLPLVRALLAKGANPNARESKGLTALMLAFAGREQHSIPSGDVSMTGNAEDPARLLIVRELLHAGANVNAQDGQGRTALLCALRTSTSEVVRSLRDAGADVNRADATGQTPLMALLERRQEGDTAARSQPWSAAMDLAAALIARGAHIDAQDHNGDTALQQVVQKPGMDSLLNLLLAHGADVNRHCRDGRTALMALAENNAPDEAKVRTAQRLLDRGADAFARDRYGWTALTYAAMMECQPLIAAWREKGLKIGLIDAVFLRDVPAVRTQLAAGANPNTRTSYGETVLMIAAQQGDAEIVRALLAHGADPNARDLLGLPTLILAIRGYASDYLDSSAETVREEPFRTAIVQALLERGAKVNFTRKYHHNTPLIMAAALGKADIVRLLLKHGADMTCRDRDGQTAIADAERYGHPDIVALLKQAGAK